LRVQKLLDGIPNLVVVQANVLAKHHLLFELIFNLKGFHEHRVDFERKS
jgi:hypothetical protein